MSADPNLEVLGQKLIIPASYPGVLGLLGVVAGLVLIGYFAIAGIVDVVTRGKSENIQEIVSLFTSKEITKTSGNPEIKTESTGDKLVQFWTPSAETQLDLASGSADGQVPADDLWEKTDEVTVDRFEIELWNQFHENARGKPLHGLRRYQTVGRGRTHHKRGWWWMLNVDRDFDSRDLARFYFSFWKTSKQLYVEELNSSAAYE